MSKTPITGTPTISAKCIAEFLVKNNYVAQIACTPLELATHFIEEGRKLNIRGDIAFCQSIHETGWFKYGGQVLPEQNNYAGIGATNNSPVGKGAWFDSPQIGVRAQIQHLFAYATKDALTDVCVDPRFPLVTRGIAPNWEDLNGRWAVPGTTYAQSILSLFDKLVEFDDTFVDESLPVIPTEPVPSFEPSPWAKDAWEWAFNKGICDGTRPFDQCTREELVTMLYRVLK